MLNIPEVKDEKKKSMTYVMGQNLSKTAQLYALHRKYKDFVYGKC